MNQTQSKPKSCPDYWVLVVVCHTVSVFKVTFMLRDILFDGDFYNI